MPISFKGDGVIKFHQEILNDEFHRYKSWEHCYNAFLNLTNEDLLCLHLAFYLASWGMYRGSSGILQKDHRIHLKAVQILREPKYKDLWCTVANEITIHKIDLVLELKKELKNHYKEIPFKRLKKDGNISPTDTLISKILLGTQGCTPAYDRYYIDGLKHVGLEGNKLNRISLENLFNYIENNLTAITECQNIINEKSKVHYPLMKIIDMYFWQIGYENAK